MEHKIACMVPLDLIISGNCFKSIQADSAAESAPLKIKEEKSICYT